MLLASKVIFIDSAVPPSIAILNQYEPPAVNPVFVPDVIADKPNS